MKIRITKNHVDALCVLIGVLGMGSLYFQVLRMPLMAAMLIASILLLTRAHHPKISVQNVRLTLLLTAALLLTSFVNPQNGIHINDIVIWLCNIGYVLVLQSCIGYRTYMRLYTKVMLAEAAISLISFVIGDLLSLPLPLLHYEVSSVNGFYLTPYFTLGWLNIPVFHRNAGMFNEPGSHQIFLNFALLFLMSDETRMGMSKKKYCWAIALLIVTHPQHAVHNRLYLSGRCAADGGLPQKGRENGAQHQDGGVRWADFAVCHRVCHGRGGKQDYRTKFRRFVLHAVERHLQRL